MKFCVACQGVFVASQVDQACREQECPGAEQNALLGFDFRQNYFRLNISACSECTMGGHLVLFPKNIAGDEGRGAKQYKLSHKLNCMVVSCESKQ